MFRLVCLTQRDLESFNMPWAGLMRHMLHIWFALWLICFWGANGDELLLKKPSFERLSINIIIIFSLKKCTFLEVLNWLVLTLSLRLQPAASVPAHGSRGASQRAAGLHAQSAGQSVSLYFCHFSLMLLLRSWGLHPASMTQFTHSKKPKLSTGYLRLEVCVLLWQASWEKRVLKSLNSMSTELGVPLARMVGRFESEDAVSVSLFIPPTELKCRKQHNNQP